MQVERKYHLLRGRFQHVDLLEVLDPVRVDNTVTGNIVEIQSVTCSEHLHDNQGNVMDGFGRGYIEMHRSVDRSGGIEQA